MQQVDQELRDAAVANVTEQQGQAFESLVAEAVEEHLEGECPACKEELSSNCEEQIATRIEERQEEQFDDQVEAEYDRLEEQREEQEAE